MCSSFFAGHEETYDFLRQLTYQKSDVILMCFSLDNPDSLENIETKWIPEVRQFCPKGTAFSQFSLTSLIIFYLLVALIVLVGNKKDIAESNLQFVKREDCLAMARKNYLFTYLECSAKWNNGVDDVFQAVIEAIKTKCK